ncbi:MAG: rRNA maturation RNase YbeY, partial [Thermomicrobiales bacterium]|nr:rRNA maturation RNase YbeY [Thermomicrobiales bacterium]
FTDDEHIARLHREFMGIPGPTDILTFADDEERGGDIVISVDQADRQRQDDDWSLLEELRFLTVHGALHLTGWDDATDTQRQEMLDRQRALIAQFLADSASTR